MRGRLRVWLAVWAGWTALALFFAVSTSLSYTSTGRPPQWGLTISRSLSEWWIWAALTPLVAWLARRYPLVGPGRGRHAALHVGAGLALAVAVAAAQRATFALLSGFWLYWLVSTFALQFFVYAGLVAAAHGVEFYRRSREREQLEARLAETRLQLLNVQLQPHFLFNTLNTIAELVHEDPETADRMITGLSDLLRRALELGSAQEIPLDAELDLLGRYLDIQGARFGDRLQVRVRVPAELRRARVPVLLLQPIVENAIRHGIGSRVRAGGIDVEARRDDDTLVIEVTDDGAAGNGGTLHAREGVGLGNTRARLQALYGSGGRLELNGAPGRGACVRLQLPFREAAATP